MNIVDRIRALANNEGMSLPDLELKLKLGNGTISRWKNSSPNSDKITKVADYFGVTVDYLLCRTDNPVLAITDNNDSTYFKIMKEAQKDGISPHDLSLAIEFLKEARNRDKK